MISESPIWQTHMKITQKEIPQKWGKAELCFMYNAFFLSIPCLELLFLYTLLPRSVQTYFVVSTKLLLMIDCNFTNWWTDGVSRLLLPTAVSGIKVMLRLTNFKDHVPFKVSGKMFQVSSVISFIAIDIRYLFPRLNVSFSSTVHFTNKTTHCTVIKWSY